MNTTKESQVLLAEFADSRSASAFRRLVELHTPLVFSAALRSTRGNLPLAQDVVQTTFCGLAQKAGNLSSSVIVSAWLYRFACNTARTLLRAESRRQKRELAAGESLLASDVPAQIGGWDWEAVSPLLDAAMADLPELERSALVLRYFEKCTLREVGESLGWTEDATQKRVARAIERLRKMILKGSSRFVCPTASVLTLLLNENTTAAVVPQSLCQTAASTALASPAAKPGLMWTHFLIAPSSASKLWLACAAILVAIAAPIAWRISSASPTTSSAKPNAPAPIDPTARQIITAEAKPNATVVQPTQKTRQPSALNIADSDLKAAFTNHPRTVQAEKRMNILKLGNRKLMEARVSEIRIIEAEIQRLSVSADPADLQKTVELQESLQVKQTEMAEFKANREHHLTTLVIAARDSILEEITSKNPPSAPRTRSERESELSKVADQLFANQQFSQVEPALLSLLHSGNETERQQVAWKLMLAQLAQGNNSKDSVLVQQTLQGPRSHAVANCFSYAVEAIGAHDWPTAQIWVTHAQETDASEAKEYLDELISMGWAELDAQGSLQLLPP